MRSSDLAQRISKRLLQDIATGGLSVGQHLGAQQLADRYGVSRTPVREAMNILETDGFLVRQENRGFFVAEADPKAITSSLEAQPESADDDYWHMANDWLSNRLPEEITEQLLRHTYGWTKSRTTDCLVRAAREGWAERKEGYGWRFLPVAKTAAAFDEIYRFRLAIEPSALLEPSFEIDRKALDEQKRIQSTMLENGTEQTPAEALLRNGAVFHEEITRMSNNPYFLAALKRVNRMRRLMEYRAEIDHARFTGQCTEHLELIDLLERGETVEASYFMRRHLGGALEKKSPLAWDRAGTNEQ